MLFISEEAESQKDERSVVSSSNRRNKKKVLPHCTYIENHLGIDIYVYPESEHKSRKRLSVHSMSNHVVTLSGDITTEKSKTTLPFHFKSVTLDSNQYRSIRNVAVYTNR